MTSTPARRGVLVVALAVVALVVLGQLAVRLSSAFSDGPRGPVGSSYATGEGGLSRYRDLLRHDGYDVQRRRQALDVDTPLDPARDTVVVLDAPQLLPSEGTALQRFLVSGGRAVLGGRDPGRWLASAVPDPPTWQRGGNPSCHSVVPVPETRGVTDVVLTSSGSFGSVGSSLPILACGGRVSATVAAVGGAGGRVVLLGDSGPLQNQWLAAREDATFGLDLAGPGRRVVFDEQVHGFGAPSGPAGLPAPARAALVLGLLALAAAAAATATRPHSRPAVAAPGPPGRRVLVDALGASLARGRPEQVAVPVQRAARSALAERAGVGWDGSDDALRAAGRRAGLDAEDVEAVLAPGADRPGLLRAGRALAVLSGP